MKRRQFVTSVLATGLVALCSGSPAWAGIQPEPFRTGLFGITAGQTIRVSVVNAGGIINPCVMPEVLVSAVRLRDLAGRPLFESKGQLLLEGEGTFVDIPWEDPATILTRARRLRTQVRAEVVLEFDHTLLQRGDLLLMLEVFEPSRSTRSRRSRPSRFERQVSRTGLNSFGDALEVLSLVGICDSGLDGRSRHR